MRKLSKKAKYIGKHHSNSDDTQKIPLRTKKKQGKDPQKQ